MKQDRILIVGAGGQIGAVLTETLRETYGADNVLATDLRPLENQTGPSQTLDALDGTALAETAQKFGATQLYHLAAILSATGPE